MTYPTMGRCMYKYGHVMDPLPPDELNTVTIGCILCTLIVLVTFLLLLWPTDNHVTFTVVMAISKIGSCLICDRFVLTTLHYRELV